MKAELCRDGRGGARMVRLNSANRDERIRALAERLGNREFQLADFVAAEAEWNGVVAFRQQAWSAAKRRSKAGQLLNRRWSREKRET